MDQFGQAAGALIHRWALALPVWSASCGWSPWVPDVLGAAPSPLGCRCGVPPLGHVCQSVSFIRAQLGFLWALGFGSFLLTELQRLLGVHVAGSLKSTGVFPVSGSSE